MASVKWVIIGSKNVLCCGYTLTDFPISIRLTSLALWQSNDCPSASKATLMNMDKYFMWIHYEWLHNHNKAKHNKTVCIFLGIYCTHWPQKDMAKPFEICHEATWHYLNPYCPEFDMQCGFKRDKRLFFSLSPITYNCGKQHNVCRLLYLWV